MDRSACSSQILTSGKSVTFSDTCSVLSIVPVVKPAYTKDKCPEGAWSNGREYELHIGEDPCQKGDP